MIYLIDNGVKYTGHAVYICEATPDQIEPLLALMAKAWPREPDEQRPYLLATTDRLEWYTGKPMPFLRCMDRLSFNMAGESTADNQASEDFNEAVDKLLAEAGFANGYPE